MAGPEDTQALWADYKRTGTKALRDRLVLTYAPLVKYVAGRLGSGLPAHVEDADLVSRGLLGLIRAIERFDPDRNVKFETHAIASIRGAIVDELRSMDWVPRSVRARASDIERAIAELERKLMRAPNDDEIAARLGITEEEFEESLLEISRSSIAALDELWSGSWSRGEPQQATGHTELREALAEAIARLPERERLVLTLYYWEELTLREIGEVLGVTESRVSQLHATAILRLKAARSRARRPSRKDGRERRHPAPDPLDRG